MAPDYRDDRAERWKVEMATEAFAGRFPGRPQARRWLFRNLPSPCLAEWMQWSLPDEAAAWRGSFPGCPKGRAHARGHHFGSAIVEATFEAALIRVPRGAAGSRRGIAADSHGAGDGGQKTKKPAATERLPRVRSMCELPSQA